MVQRYELEEMSRNPFESYRCLEDNEEGDWVKYEDYAELRELLREVVEDCYMLDVKDETAAKLKAFGFAGGHWDVS